VAQIQPEWIEKIGGHLLKKSWGEPRWEKRPAQVTASEKATLYGLVVYSQRRINYAQHNPIEAREIFIRDALVGGDYDTRAPFFAHNQKLIKEIENLEHKSRRQDVLVDDQLIEAFYDKLVPSDVVNGAGFEAWYKAASHDDPKLLYLIREDLMRHEAAGVTTELFPKKMMAAGLETAADLSLRAGQRARWRDAGGAAVALNQLSRERCEWLVPGMLKEKVHLLLKSLPQKLRRHMVPLPDYAAKFCDRVHAKLAFGRGDLVDAIIADIREQITINVLTTDFKPETLPAHHFMNFKVIDEHGRQLDMGRNLAKLQGEYGSQARESFQKMAEATPASATGAADGRHAAQAVAWRHRGRCGARRQWRQGPGGAGAGSANAGRAFQHHQLDVRRAAGTAGDQAGQAEADRLPGAGGQGHALRPRSVRRSERGGAHAPHRPAPPVRAADEGPDQVR
jgi:ATP-dependent helicase HrpA